MGNYGSSEENRTPAMRAAISHAIGSHEFKSFEGMVSPRSDPKFIIMAAEHTAHEVGLSTFLYR
ncbi:hypothetical protein D1AOALGA4SA_11317 [Olavius algarvensis Delta 1 endosymbiont]|nr:hypothetical protein D1AOALGA4SA_11317 [Olavius algarvensis Delta 1 endosymbiont]